MRSSGNTGKQERKTDHREETIRKRNNSGRPKHLFIVGIGPGGSDHMSGMAKQAICESDVIVGYTKYIDLISDLVSEKRTISTGMTKEIDRVWAAIELAMDGVKCAIVSSGDPGIYAMAGLAFEMCIKKEIPLVKNAGSPEGLLIEVIPGIPALSAAASRLGAPLMHDFASISLSDLLTPWEVIEKRLHAAASADFVIVLYNPKSKKRDWQLSAACGIIKKYRSASTPVGIVTNAMRKGESIRLTSLGRLEEADVDMLTTVIIGNSCTYIHSDFMITPRGYSKKYKL